jgi:transcriptional regulator with XRE-family HTH domain
LLSTVYVDKLVPMKLSTENVEITPAQCRGARGIIDFTQPELASKAGLGLSTVIDFERSRRPVSAKAIAAIRAALEAAGVEFTNGEQPGVRMRKR